MKLYIEDQYLHEGKWIKAKERRVRETKAHQRKESTEEEKRGEERGEEREEGMRRVMREGGE